PAAFSRQIDARKFFGIAEFSIRIVVIDQAERNVHDRNLNTKFQADARTKIADLVERRIRNTEQRILLYIAAKVKLLNFGRKAGRTTDAVAAAKLIDKMRFRHYAAAVIQNAAVAALQDRRIYQAECSKSSAAQEPVVFQKFAVDD